MFDSIKAQTLFTKLIGKSDKLNEYIEIFESIKKGEFSKSVETASLYILSQLKSPKFNPSIAPYFEKINPIGVPFTDFSLEPDSISQIKKIINALYHARLALLDLEGMDLRNHTYEGMATIKQTIQPLWEACYLITHPDVDFSEIFSEVLTHLLPLLAHFNKIAVNKLDELNLEQRYKDWPTQLLNFSDETLTDWPFKFGKVAGSCIEQMQPQTGSLDFDVLTQFSAKLPSDLEKITLYLWNYGSQTIPDRLSRSLSQYSTVIAPKLDQQKIAELQKEAFKLKTELEDLKSTNIFWFKLIPYIRIIRNILHLSTTTLEQLTNLVDESHDLIRELLARLKYVEFIKLFNLVDRIEVDAMLKPGTLSLPLMKKIKSLYGTLIDYASKPVNFQKKGEELLCVEDPHFINLRLEQTYKKIDTINKSLYKIEEANQAFAAFCQIIENPAFKNIEFSNLPPSIKSKLIDYYKIIKPYVHYTNPNLNNDIIDHLLESKQNAPLSFILEHKKALQDYLVKKRTTYEFHIKLNKDLIDATQKQAQLTLFPFKEKTNPFIINEADAFSTQTKPNEPQSKLKFEWRDKQKVVTNPEGLTAEQALELSLWYENKRNKLFFAKKAYQELTQILSGTTQGEVLKIQFNNDLKLRCRNLYYLVQPYLINGIPAKLRETALDFDRHLIKSFSIVTKKSPAPIKNLFIQTQDHFNQQFEENDSHWKNQSLKYLALVPNKAQVERESIVLAHTQTDAKKPVSEYINIIRQVVFEIKSVFNQSMQTELTPQPEGVPFPELEHYPQILAQGEQVLVLKKLFNTLYHLEKTASKLEQLREDEFKATHMYYILKTYGHSKIEQLREGKYKATYMSYIYRAYGHLYHIHQLAKSFTNNSYFNLIAQQGFEKASTLLSSLIKHSEPYQVSAASVAPDEPVQYNAIWYGLNAFFIIPKDIKATINHSKLSETELHTLHQAAKKSTLKIEQIINSSNSYFQLFLQTPNMYFLYQNLTEKLKEFVSTVHDATTDNLSKLRSACFTPMLLEADVWEIKLGLKPGTFSGPLKLITDHLYKGFLESLELNSKHYLQLLCDKEPIDKRIRITKEEISSVQQHLTKLKEKYHPIEHLYNLLEQNKNISKDKLPCEELNHVYQKALPKLIKLQKKLNLPTATNSSENQWNQFFNPELNPAAYPIKNLNTLIDASYHLYQGKKATIQMRLGNTEEQLSYLTQEKHQHQHNTLQFTEKFTIKTFDRHIKSLVNCPIGLHHSTQKIYTTHLIHHLNKFREHIINEAKTTDDITLRIKNLLKKHILEFEKKNFNDYYYLGAVKTALVKFTNYFMKTPTLFEDKKTLEEKSKQINALIEIVEKEEELIGEERKYIPIKVRLEKIQAIVNTYQFKKIILKTKNEEHISLNYLIKCFLSLLEALHLYNPTHKNLYNQLEKVINKKPEVKQIPNYSTFFSNISPKLANQKNPIGDSPKNSKPSNNTEPKPSLASQWNDEGQKRQHHFLSEINKKSPADQQKDTRTLTFSK